MLQTDLALIGGICDNSLLVGDIYVHDKETRPLYVKFTMSFLMSSGVLGFKNSVSHKINSLCLVMSFWACGSGCTRRLRGWGPEVGWGRMLLPLKSPSVCKPQWLHGSLLGASGFYVLEINRKQYILTVIKLGICGENPSKRFMLVAPWGLQPDALFGCFSSWPPLSCLIWQ